MTKNKMISKEIEAYIFQDGMEDGWLLCLFSFSEWSVPMREFFNSRNAAEEAETALSRSFHVSGPFPYINTTDGKKIIKIGDYVIKCANGVILSMDKQTFDVSYELCI